MNDNGNAKCLRRYAVLKQLLEHCYSKKKVSDECKLQIGEIVLIKQENVPRLKWHKGRVMNCLVGPDKRICRVILRTIKSNGKRITLKRSLPHLVRLEVREENETADKTSDNNINDGNTINVNIEKELRKSRGVAAMIANLIRRLNEED